MVEHEKGLAVNSIESISEEDLIDDVDEDQAETIDEVLEPYKILEGEKAPEEFEERYKNVVYNPPNIVENYFNELFEEKEIFEIPPALLLYQPVEIEKQEDNVIELLKPESEEERAEDIEELVA